MKEKTLSLEMLVIVSLILFFIACALLDINILSVDKTGFYKSTKAYETYVLKTHFLFIYIFVLVFLLNIYRFLSKKIYKIEDIGKVVLYSYLLLFIFALSKITYIVIMPSKTSSAVSFLMPPVLYDIMKGLSEVHLLYFFALLPLTLIFFNGISKFILKYSNHYICFIVSTILLVAGTYLFAQFCLYCDALYPVL